MRTKIRIPFWQKALLSAFGCFLAVIILEAGLRLGGFIILSLQDYRNTISLSHKGAYRILCLGESTTQGEYPPFLEKILNQSNIGMRFSVIDKGRSGTTMNVILSQVESYLDEYHPDMVVAMMGMNDESWEGHIPYERPTSSKPLLFIRSFKTYKLARLLWLHMVTKAKELGLYKAQEKEETVKKPIEHDPRNDEAYLRLGWTCGNQGKFTQAEEFLKKAIELNPKNSEACRRLGWVYKTQGKLPQAEEFFKKILELDSNNTVIHLELAWIYGIQRNFTQAEVLIRKVIELNPNDTDAYLCLGWIYKNQSMLLKAEEFIRKAIELNPRNNEAYFGLGWVYTDQDKYLQAEEFYRKAIELNPKNAEAYLGLGWVYKAQGKFTQTEELFKKAILECDLNQKARFYGALGNTYEAMGKIILSKEYYDKANQTRLNEYLPLVNINYLKLKDILYKRNIKLVCVQYPMRSIEPLKAIFKDDIDGMIFVDNESIFKSAVSQKGLTKYFRDMFGGDFGHCTPEGNRLLAENIAQVILKRVFHKVR